jgi:hypothetical protein
MGRASMIGSMANLIVIGGAAVALGVQAVISTPSIIASRTRLRLNIFPPLTLIDIVVNDLQNQ